MKRGEICKLAERLAEKWSMGKACDVIDKIMSLPLPAAVAVAAAALSISSTIPEMFDAGPRFRSVLLDRAESTTPVLTAAENACTLLVAAYNRGAERGDSIDWEDGKTVATHERG